MTQSPLSGSSQSAAAVLRQFPPFDQLNEAAAQALQPLLQPRRFQLGQTVLRPDVLPDGVLLILQGQLRGLGPETNGPGLQTIERLGPGSVIGWAGLVRRDPCEHLRAASEIEALLLPAAAFRDLVESQPALSAWFEQHLPSAELHTLLTALAEQQPQWLPKLQQWPAVVEQARVRSLVPGPETALALPQGYCWFASSGRPLADTWADQPLEPLAAGSAWLRLIGLPDPLSESLYAETPGDIQLDPPAVTAPLLAEVLGPGEYSLSPEAPAPKAPGARQDYISLRRASGPRDIPIAVCQSLADYFGVPINRDALIDQVEAILQRQKQLSLTNLGQILDSLGLRVMLTRVPTDRLARVPTPAVLIQNQHIGVLDGVDPDGQARLLEAELGPVKVPCEDLSPARTVSWSCCCLSAKVTRKNSSSIGAGLFRFCRNTAAH